MNLNIKFCKELQKTRMNRIDTEEKRRTMFKDSIKYGRRYECVSCHRVCFENGVHLFTCVIESKLEKDYPGLIKRAIGAKQTLKTHEDYHICITCKSHLSKGKVPPMSNQNKLQLMDLTSYEELHLTELENSMIALNIIFQKVFNLPKSRWPGMKDKTVNIPIFETDVIKTIESLPRTPSDAGIIPVNFKRKLIYKNSHMVQYISVPKILKALQTLKELGNKYYQFVPQNVNFEDECREHDLEGFRFIYPEDEIECEDNSKEVEDDKLETEEDNVEKEEEEYQKHDPVKKWQFQYNKSTCFSNNYPEISYKEDHRDNVSVAPGEGKTPSNILQETDWD